MLKQRSGFTLIEILVVATIIGLLAAVGAVSYTSFNKQSRDTRRKADLEQIRAAVEMYRSTNNSYPPTLQDVVGTYLKSEPTDPKTNSPYTYTPDCQGDVCNNYTAQTILEAGGCYEVGPYGSSVCSIIKPTPTGGFSGPPPTPTPNCVPPNGACNTSTDCCNYPQYLCSLAGGARHCEFSAP